MPQFKVGQRVKLTGVIEGTQGSTEYHVRFGGFGGLQVLNAVELADAEIIEEPVTITKEAKQRLIDAYNNNEIWPVLNAMTEE